MTSATPATRGRPRSADRTDAILEATNELCRELGYDGLRMQDVADRAGTGLATIYRRWPNKPALVAAAMHAKPFIQLEPTGDAEADLRQLIHSMATDMGGGDMVVGFLGAVREHEELRAALVESVMGGIRPVLREAIVAIAPDAPSLDFLVDSIAGTLIVRSALFDDERDPSAFADEVVELVRALR